jgi:phosphoenolpyruvate synthase/pyruvate phosphate dikinase
MRKSKQKIILKGIPASSGRCKGVVKILLSPLDQSKLKKGEILVAPFTTPAYT